MGRFWNMIGMRSIVSLIKKVDNLLDSKISFLLFLILFLGALVPVLGYMPHYNFWLQLHRVLTNSIFNTIYFLALGLAIGVVSKKLVTNCNFVMRYSSYRDMFKAFIKDIIFITIFIYMVALILAVAGSVLFSFGDFSLINYSNYDISIILYLLFFVIRSIALSCIIAVILFIVINVFRKDISIVVFVILNSAFLIVPSSQEIINHFYDCCFLYHYYFLDIRYASFFLEFLCSVLFVLIMLIICNVFYKVLCKKKRELV